MSKGKKLACGMLALAVALSSVSTGFAAMKSNKQSAESVIQVKQPIKVVEKQRKSQWDGDKPETKNNSKASFVSPKGNSYATDRVIVKYKSDSAANTVRSTFNVKTLKKLTNINAEVISIPTGKTVSSFVSELKKNKNVVYAQPDYKIYRSTNDPSYNELWGVNNTGQSILGVPGVTNIDIDAPEAWTITQGDNNIIVGVIDEGIDYNHPDLINNIWTNPGEIDGNGLDDDYNGYVDDIHGWDFWNYDNTVYDPTDGDAHGTHVAGTIAAAANNNIGVAGVAPNVQLMSLKFLGPEYGYTSDAALAVEYATNMGVKIINNSWGGGSYNQALKDAIDNSNALFVAAAGNQGLNVDYYPHYPSSYDSSNILSVAAIDNQGYLASFSNYGTSVDVAAPGVNILSTLPYNSYEYYSGTSMATPHVTGAAALLYSQNPNLTSEQAIEILKTTGTSLPSLQGLVGSGKLINANNALTGNTPPPPSGDDDIPGVPIVGIVQESLDEVFDTDDVYSIYLYAGETINAKLTGETSTDFDLYLYSKHSETVKTSEGIISYSENAETSDEQINFTVSENGTYYLNVFSYAGSGQYTLETGNGPGVYEDDNNALIYSGTWNTLTGADYSNGTAKQINSKGSLTFNFIGTDIEWKGFKNAQQGIANVYIDGELIATPSLYASTLQTQQSIFKHTVPAGMHTIEIEWTGKRSSLGRKTSTNINIDSLVVSLDEDTEAPVISNVLPTDGTSVESQFTITGTATDNKIVNYVWYNYYYYNNDEKVLRTHKLDLNSLDLNRKASNEWPFEIPIDLAAENFPAGPVYIELGAVDGSGNESDIIYRTYEHLGSDQIAPVVESLSPEDGATVGSQFNITGTATDNKEVYNVWVYYEYTVASGETISKKEPVQVKSPDTNSKASDVYYFDIPIDLQLVGAVEGPVYIEAWAEDSSWNVSESVFRNYFYEIENQEPIVTRIEDNDSSIIYSGSWLTASSQDYSGGTVKYGTDAGLSTEFSFTGTGIRWLSIMSSTYGLVDVYIDGNLVQTVNLYSPTAKYQQTVFEINNLPNTSHTIKLVNKGQKGDPSGSGARISIDAFEIIQSNVDTIKPVIETLSPAEGATVGSQFYISGTATDNKEVYNVWVYYEYTVASGETVSKKEQVQVKSPDVNHIASDVYYFDIPIDLELVGAIEGPVYIEAWAEDSSWNVSESVFRNYTYSISDTTNPVIESLSPADGATVGSLFNITGTAIDNKEVYNVWVYYEYTVASGETISKKEQVQVKSPDTNSKASDVYYFDIPIDLQLVGAVEGPVYIEAWAEDSSWNISESVFRNYFYEIENQEPIVTRIEDNNSSIIYSGSWLTAQSQNYSGGTVKYGSNADLTAELSFTGTGIRWLSIMSTTYGLVDVYIDGTLIQTVNLYSPTAIYQQTVFEINDLPNTSHTIKLVNKGQKGDPSASGTRISLDAFEVIQSNVDTTKPVIEALNPTDGATVGSQFNITGTATDNNEVYDVWVYYEYTVPSGERVSKKEQVQVKSPDTNSNASDVYYFDIPIDLQLVGAIEGPVYIEAWAEDTTGNTSEIVFRNYTYSISDTTNPMIESLSPADGATVGSQFNITGTATDNKEVYDVWVYYEYTIASGEKVNKKEQVPVKSPDTNSKASDVYYFDIPIDLQLDGAVEGPVYIEAWAEDSSWNVSESVFRNYYYDIENEEPIVTRIEDNNSSIIYSGSWLTAQSQNYSGGTVKYGSNADLTAGLSFTGTGIRWLSIMSSTYGLVDVYIDGNLVQTVNLYSPTAKYQQTVFEINDLPNTSHTIKLVNKGQKGDSSASGTRISLDAFEVIQ